MPGRAPEPFLLEQPIWLLEPPDNDNRWDIGVTEDDPGGDHERNGCSPEIMKCWNRINRQLVVKHAQESVKQGVTNDPHSWKRVALISAAGLGKTTNLKWLGAQINRLDEGRNRAFAFYVELDNLGDSQEAIHHQLVQHIQSYGGSGRVGEMARRMLVQGRVIFLLDSIDQADPSPNGSAIKKLQLLLRSDFEQCPVWITGRPYAFRIAQHAIGALDHEAEWRFLRVGLLDQPESWQLLERGQTPEGKKANEFRYRKLTNAGRRLARVPRFARLLALASHEVLDKIDNNAGAYWHLFSLVSKHPDDETGMIDSGLRSSEGAKLGWQTGEPEPDRRCAFNGYATRIWQRDLAFAMIGAIAFEMYCRKSESGAPSFEIRNDLAGFKFDVCRRLAKSNAYVNELGHPIPIARVNAKSVEESIQIAAIHFLREDWPRLQHMNSHGIEFSIFGGASGCLGDGSDAKQEYFFSDISAQAFFAAYWALKWGGDDERDQIRKWIPDPASGENLAYQGFWDLLAQMPPEAICDSDHAHVERRFQEICAPLYDKRLQPDPDRPIRSTQLMHRYYERMKTTQAMEAFRREIGQLQSESSEVYQSLFTNRRGQPQFVKLADTLDPIDNWDTGKFTMGEFEDWSEEQSVEPFLIANTCVTNRQYSVFNPRFNPTTQFLTALNGSPDNHPAVHITWHDAWAYTLWLGEFQHGSQAYRACIPNEVQWEYACRCGESTRFTWQDRDNGDRIRRNDANFDTQNPWPPTDDPAAGIRMLGRTIAADGVDPELELAPNPWGIYQMHGNVWEWTSSWYNDLEQKRVLRGGGWFNMGRQCQSDTRSAHGPTFRRWWTGFRLAAVNV